ncbi:MAG TPA: PD-(D/E)XK nuclease family protein [Verrucomicrobiae bacterium]|nr:PD-(D/E)XK nuclease family protein [Verrucomicrobiae bacterium]
MQVRFLLGPAGSGKTHRCLSEARRALAASAEGLPLALVAPRQGTYQLEQQLLSTPSLAGYTRLSIVSFESLARLVLRSQGLPCPPLLSEEGRMMVLRSLLAKQRDGLKLFRASARLNGFAAQVNETLKQLQHAALDLEQLHALAARLGHSPGVQSKLHDLAVLLKAYQAWLSDHSLQDQEALLRTAAEALRCHPHSFRLEALWVDGFAEFSELELELLASIAPSCEAATFTFCLDRIPTQKTSWLSHWTTIERSFEKVRKRFAALPGLELTSEVLPRAAPQNRFWQQPTLQHLERFWDTPKPFDETTSLATPSVTPQTASESGAEMPVTDAHLAATESPFALHLVACPDQEAEVILAAREILRFVRAGGRFRQASVLLRTLERHQRLVQRIFTRYDIPFFLDRRESVTHHPLAELTRGALRVVAFGWLQEDWFAVLKSGLVPVPEEEIDLLENEALERGWQGRTWLQPFQLREAPRNDSDRKRLETLQARLEDIRRRCVPPFEQLATSLAAAGNRPSGPQLAEALRNLWQTLGAQQRLEIWSATRPSQSGVHRTSSVHDTVWRQMNEWLDNAELAFPGEPLSLREWLPILEAGLANLSIGIIPPALDQVLVGAVDRSRTPEVEFTLVLGLNEGAFPASPQTGQLLTDSDRVELENLGVSLGPTVRHQIARENYLAYIACTRAHRKLLLTWASQDAAGAPLNPSSAISRIRELFPDLPVEVAPQSPDWTTAEHSSELVSALLQGDSNGAELLEKLTNSSTSSIPGLGQLVERISRFGLQGKESGLPPDLAAQLYGPVLKTSVSRMEQFAACPFKFFVHSGLRAEERKLFELDAREQGTFQHDVLALFHETLRSEGKLWRDLTPEQARERIAQLSQSLIATFRSGLLQASHESRFTARIMTQSLQDFVEILVGWMREQYRFDPVQVEMPFGEEGPLPPWQIELGDGKRLELHGRIDRIDLYPLPGSREALGVVVDYKSSQKQLDSVLVQQGIQLQLLAYLTVVRQWPDAGAAFGVERIRPAGVFYVNLRGRYQRERNRMNALADPSGARRLAYRHTGRFDTTALRQLDARDGAVEGDQFNYRLTNKGEVQKNCKEALSSSEFQALLSHAHLNLRRMGQQIYSGRVEVDPYRKGLVTACDQCTYQAICRMDPWTHSFRVLSAKPGDLPTEPTDGP